MRSEGLSTEQTFCVLPPEMRWTIRLSKSSERNVLSDIFSIHSRRQINFLIFWFFDQVYEGELCEKYNMQIRFLTLGQSDISLHFKQKANVPLYPKLTEIELGTCATEWPEDKKHYMKEFRQDLSSWLKLIPWTSTDLLSVENPSRNLIKILRFILIWYGLQP